MIISRLSPAASGGPIVDVQCFYYDAFSHFHTTQAFAKEQTVSSQRKKQPDKLEGLVQQKNS